MLNQTLQMISMVLCVVGIAQVIIAPRQLNVSFWDYIVFYAVLLLYSGSILTALLLSGMEGAAVHAILTAAVFLEFFMLYLLTFHVINWLLSRVQSKADKREVYTLRIILCVMLIAQTAILTVSQFTGLYYTIDSSNIYHRHDGMIWNIVLLMAEFLVGIYALLRFRGALRRRSLFAFSAFAALYGIAFAMQIMFSEVYYITVASAFSVVVLYLYVGVENSQLYYQNERMIEKLKVDMMLSQIQPHFLFNSLTTIKHLCRRDPATAEKAVTDFSLFLRGNMSSINSDALIPFAKELEHTRSYLSLEELRFGDALRIEYDIEAEGFVMPPLTLQPIVENAVRHGIRESESGEGAVWIASREYPDRYEVTVTDDGIGFDAESLENLDSSHVGIRNVRWRLEQLCGGTLAIESAAGQGT